MLREIDLKLIGLISVKGARSSNYFNNPPSIQKSQ